ncbi:MULTISPECIES: FAD:protein FMN transferase [Alteromonas]|uniref:FAD:protein FMN transferase n=2 Tax=Alteromonas stellipolaris TaxID=233316 RepID=A0AAW7Z7I2_9ALTE|nr:MULTISPECIES: FAD:protein FMN transferase [Alteromonas]ALM89118.1 Thiamin biosynthesis lipoprotein ApbE [Alteromonas stellipolaris LMG 21856]MBZ2161262.1 FAD:protein FMN transferase [Alteromonas stellipolaris]MDO6578663.1 FAD:protein FMN transferase [Alteromonas stellipolaris]MDP2537545.1 FAD:protein FMN transferase [Alteromonas stellipolaris]
MIRFFARIALAVIAMSILFIASCSEKPLSVEHLQGQTMGTTYNIKYVLGEGETAVEGLQEEIDAKLVNINKMMSTYDTTSELSRFNQYRYSDNFAVSQETLTVVNEALRLARLSDGVLDVTVGPLVNLWGFGPNKRPEKVPTQADIDAVRDYVGYEKLSTTPTGLMKANPMLYVDLSTIAKGYGVDEVAAILDAHDLQHYLVEIGGEMRVKGERGDGSEWLIAIEKPVTTERAVQKVVSIGTNAIATSGDYRNYYEEDGKRYSHLIDPNTGSPITHDLVSVTVVNPSSMIADGLATAFNVMGWQRAIDLAEQEQLAVFLIRRTADGFEEYATPEFDKLVKVNN